MQIGDAVQLIDSVKLDRNINTLDRARVLRDITLSFFIFDLKKTWSEELKKLKTAGLAVQIQQFKTEGYFSDIDLLNRFVQESVFSLYILNDLVLELNGFGNTNSLESSFTYTADLDNKPVIHPADHFCVELSPPDGLIQQAVGSSYKKSVSQFNIAIKLIGTAIN